VNPEANIMQDAIAVTGLGCVSPLGNDADALLHGWAGGTCAIEDGSGRCSDFEPGDVMSRSQVRRTDRYLQLALAACDEAARQAGWDDGAPYDPGRVGCVTATTAAGQRTVERELAAFDDKGPKAVAPVRILLAAPDAAAVAISMRLNLQGECYGLLGACAGGAKAIGAGVRMIRSGDADAMIVGGVDAEMTGLVHATYSSLGALSKSGDCRPFDRRRDGIVPGEGAGILVLERGDRARARGATILGEILGYGASSDAHHLTVPHPPGQVLAIRNALADAGVAPSALGYINAHGTGTRLNDPLETGAIKEVLDGHAHRLPISSVKSAIGHLQGAAGAVEAVATLSALRARIAPPTLGLDEPDEELDLDYVPHHSRGLDCDGDGVIGLSNSFGLGGHNACLVLRG
jgi:3-oxoacyl-[acyl-carrier-protein] synthase II